MNRKKLFARNLKALRESYGKTQMDLSLAKGVEASTISGWETGVSQS